MGLIGSSCIFPALDIKKTAAFYQEQFGFWAVEYMDCTEPHICLYKDSIEIILLQAKAKEILSNRKLYGYGYDAYFYTDEQESLEKECLQKGVRIIKSLGMTDYKNKEFVVEDLDGRWIAFGLKVKE